MLAKSAKEYALTATNCCVPNIADRRFVREPVKVAGQKDRFDLSFLFFWDKTKGQIKDV